MEKEYQTKNLQLATFILARGGEIPTLTGERGAVTFHFPDPEEKLGWEWELFLGDTPVPARQLFWAMKELRAQMDRHYGKTSRR